ncbi:MAG TPA: hypothetical protein VLS89_19430 [Candidatus Nanopelagicales bacterium]|nr:hypothetical protein [Candidatus Nanopelagicales bacterium]
MSSYREERDALRARAESLEQDLGQVRGELREAQQALDAAQRATPRERLEQLERDLAAAQRGLRDLKGQMAATERPPPPSRIGALVAATTVGLTLLGAGTALVLMRPSPVHVAEPVQVEEPAQVEEPQIPAAPAAERARDRFEARWEGSVVSASGVNLRAGSPCVAEARLASTQGEEAIEVEGLTVRCGGVDLYRSSDELNGVSMLRSGAAMAADGKGYALIYDDTGDRTGDRSQVSLGSAAGEARVWRATVPSFDVRIKLSRTSMSTPPGAAAPSQGDSILGL